MIIFIFSFMEQIARAVLHYKQCTKTPVGFTDQQFVVQLARPKFGSKMNAYWIRLIDVVHFSTAMKELTW